MTPAAIWRLGIGVGVLAAAALLVWAGHSWGSNSRDAVWQEREATRQLEAREAFEAEVQRGQEFVEEAITEQLDQRDRYDQLEQTYVALQKTTPLVVVRRVPADPVGGARVDAPAVAPDAPAGECPGVPPEPDPVEPVFALSLGAVRMWNGALTGQDAPAGACGAAATTAEAAAACAQDSGLTPDDAWANHAINARTCAEDRLNHQNLIDFIQRKDQ